MTVWQAISDFFRNAGAFLLDHTAQILMVLLVGFIVHFFMRYRQTQKPMAGTVEWVSMRDRPPMTFLRPGKMETADWIGLGIITLVYAAVTLFNLGNMTSPVTTYAFSPNNPTVTIELDRAVNIDKVQLFTGLFHSEQHQNEDKADCCYTLEISQDGVNWYRQYNIHQTYAETFRWKYGYIDLENYPPQTQYIRITLNEQNRVLEMNEFLLYAYNEEGRAVPYPTDKMTVTPAEAATLLDEQHLAPERATILNSAHFDEIYHGRAAYEHAIGIYPYEITHPPLGKLTTAIGVKLLGMTPFGWRLMPTLFGIFMLPLIFVFIKWMFDKTVVAVCGAILFAFDFMHFVQTRISTIDVYAVFYILGMYLFMYWYFTVPMEAPFRKTFLPFFLSGLFFGVGVSSKWVCVYAGAGLAALFIIYQVRRRRYYHELLKKEAQAQRRRKRIAVPEVDNPDAETPPGDKKNPKAAQPTSAIPPGGFRRFLVLSILSGVLCFVLIPALIYSASYIPYALARPSQEMTDASGFGAQAAALTKETVKQCLDNQTYMYKYHSRLVSSHDFASRWYQWLGNIKSILYFRDTYDINTVTEVVDGVTQQTGGTAVRSALQCFNNPLVAWAGLAALAMCVMGFIKRASHTALFILIGFLSNFLPWVIISRLTYPYHYFPSLIFLVLALCYVFHRMLERDPYTIRLIYIFTGVGVLLFILFYPTLTGLTVPEWYYKHVLNWLPGTFWNPDSGYFIGWVS